MFKLKIKGKLFAILLVFTAVPIFICSFQAYKAVGQLRDVFMQNVEIAALSINELIDRNLFERYGDVQAFGYNTVAHDPNNWGKPSDENPLVISMNNYMKAYGLYKLMLLVDNDGKLLAVNNKDYSGKPLDTKRLYELNYSKEAWFTDPLSGKFLEGTNGLTGTSVQQPQIVPIVAESYKEDGYVIVFSAPVFDVKGNKIGVWVNFADFGLVEQIIDQQYAQLTASLGQNIELTVLDPSGNVIVDYDADRLAGAKYTRDPSVIGKFNLVEKKIEAAIRVVNGEHGSSLGIHARKKIETLTGFAHSKGAYDYPGLGWSVMVRIPSSIAFAIVNDANRNLLVSAAFLLLVAAISSLWIGTKAASPIRLMASVVHKLASGDKSVDVPMQNRYDEIGDISRAAEVFKKNAIRLDQMHDEQVEADKRAQSEKKQAVHDLANSFESSVKNVVDAVASAATEMDATAKSVEKTASGASERTSDLNRGINNANTSVTTVASATEELTASISEISTQVSRSASIATEAVAEAARAEEKAKGLVEASGKIGEVLTLINYITEQINLLSLNATIEAARAGEAGKGFAVVASEVKNLASQTARATEQISGEVNSIQKATGETVSAISVISKVINEINEITTAIAGAVEEQNAATNEISKSIQQAASSTKEVSDNFATVADAVNYSGNSATEMVGAANELSRQAENLRAQVDKFLDNLRNG